MTTVDLSAAPIPGYGIHADYTSRARPEYYVDSDEGIVWQPDVYTTAAAIARTLGAKRIIDVGCGSAAKLVPLHPALEIVGIDYGANLDGCRARYPWASWRHHDLEEETPLPVSDEELQDAVLISSDVIEHLVRPELLVRKLAMGLRAGARAVIISTPERERTWGPLQLGPPPNVAHVREWTQGELAAFLESEGFEHGDMLLTRSNDRENLMATILAVLVGADADAEALRAAGITPA
jgi:SAM-dependent methyltransferase